MTATTIRVQMAQRKDTAANWTAANPILLSGEIGYETDTKKFKIGNGSTNWNSLAYLPIPDGSGNLTITGNLEIGSTGSLTFEGSTADGFETTLAVTNPTADRTITMPNQSGVVLVSGNASIVDADIATNAEIAVSKLADGTARQLLQTDAAGTGVEWTSNVDIPGTLDVTGAATFDAAVTVAGDLTVNGTTTTISTQNLLVEDKNIIIGDVASPTDVTADGGGITLKGATDKTINWVDATDAWTSSERFSVPLGTAALPSLTFTGDPDTGIYSPGADQVAISTNGSGRLFINSSGQVGIGGSPATSLHLAGSSSQTIRINSNTSAGFIGTTGYITQIAANRNPIDGSIVNTGTTTAFINLEADVSNGNIQFCTTGTNNAAALERMRITSTGLVGIGTSSPNGRLDVADGDAYITKNSGGDAPGVTSQSLYIRTQSGNLARLYSVSQGSGGPGGFGGDFRIQTKVDNGALVDRFIVNYLGNVGIGTTSPSQLLTLQQTSAGAAVDCVFLNNSSVSANTSVGISFGPNVSNTVDRSAVIRGINESGGSGNATGLQFLTNADGASPTEKARIDSSGRLLVGTSSDSGGALLQVNGDRIRVGTAKTPASATATGTTGEICWDASYVYVCTATNTWKRSALSTW